MKATVDVAVIGAGISGLICALELQRANHSVAVLEARDRIGGRILASPGGVDLGGSWAWPLDSPNVIKLGREFGVKSVAQHTDGDAFHVVGGRVRNIKNQGASIIPSGPGAIRPDYPEISKRIAAELSDVWLSSRVTSIERKEGGAFHVFFDQTETETETEEVVDAATATATAPTTAPTTASKKIMTTKKMVECRRVVVAVPPAVWANTITFEPKLDSAKTEKSRRTASWCGDWVKVSIECKSSFWHEKGLSGIVAAGSGSGSGGGKGEGDTPFEVFWEGGTNALVGLGVGRDATAFAIEYAGHDRAALRTHFINALGPVFGAALLEEQVVAIHVQAWALEKETYSPSGSERDYGHPLLREPTNNGIHFAGTETERHNGHVEGAVSAGRRAAREIVDSALNLTSPGLNSQCEKKKI